MAARLQARYDELKAPAARAKRVAEYKALAALSKDPGYLDKMMKVDAAIEAGADQLLKPLADATREASGIDRARRAPATAEADSRRWLCGQQAPARITRQAGAADLAPAAQSAPLTFVPSFGPETEQ